jgi:hypothetical protein
MGIKGRERSALVCTLMDFVSLTSHFVSIYIPKRSEGALRVCNLVVLSNYIPSVAREPFHSAIKLQIRNPFSVVIQSAFVLARS